MRWADLDSLDHVNNVVYLEYAAESRAMLIEDGAILGGEISQMAVVYLRPLLLSLRPVSVVSTMDADTLTQEICVDRDGVRTVFARVTTTFGPQRQIGQHTPVGPDFPSRVRRSDLDGAGKVSPTKVFELFQEGRILFISSRVSAMSPGRFVVAGVDVTFGGWVNWRAEPYQVRGWVSSVGDSSVTIESELSDGSVVLSRATSALVGFDLATQSSRKLSDEEKAEFGAID